MNKIIKDLFNDYQKNASGYKLVYLKTSKLYKILVNILPILLIIPIIAFFYWNYIKPEVVTQYAYFIYIWAGILILEAICADIYMKKIIKNKLGGYNEYQAIKKNILNDYLKKNLLKSHNTIQLLIQFIEENKIKYDIASFLSDKAYKALTDFIIPIALVLTGFVMTLKIKTQDFFTYLLFVGLLIIIFVLLYFFIISFIYLFNKNSALSKEIKESLREILIDMNKKDLLYSLKRTKKLTIKKREKYS